MAITDLQPNPKRVEMGIPLTSLIHDQCHDWVTPYNIMAAAVNALVLSGSVLPAGVIEMYAGTTLPTGYLWCDGSVVSQATYSALYAAIGTTWNTGGEGAGNFRLPKPQGRVPMCANPLNGISADTPTLTNRTLATKYGAESYVNASVAVTGNTPAITWSPPITIPALSIVNTVTASITNPAISVSGGTLSGVPNASITDATINVSIGTLAVSPVTASIDDPAIIVTVNESGGGTEINSENVTPTLNYAACVSLVEGENPKTFPPCDLTVNTFTVPIAKTSITGALDVSASIVDSNITVAGGVLSGTPTASIANPAISVSIGSLAVSPVTASITNPAITIGGVLATTSQGISPSITAPSTALSGVTASINVPTIPPALTFNFIIKT